MKKTKRYEVYSLTDTSIFKGSVRDYTIPVEVLQKLAKDLGFSYELYLTVLTEIDDDAADKLVNTMTSRSNHREILLLLDDELMQVVGYTLETSRNPLLNYEFLEKVEKIVSTSDVLKMDRPYNDDNNTIASVILKLTNPISVEEVYEGKDSNFIDYTVGVLLTNNELESATCRLVMYVGNQPTYLPASNYSSSTTRYKKSTSSSSEALEVLLLKIIDDVRLSELDKKLKDIHYRYRYNKQIITTYEEYNSLLTTMRKMPSIIEDDSVLEPLTSLFDDFERKYNTLQDQKSSFIWRCTAIGEITIESLIHKACAILNDLYAPEIECLAVRDILGSYISTPRIVEDIAKDSSI